MNKACDPTELRHFVDTYSYRDEAFFVDEVIHLDDDAHVIEATVATDRAWPIAVHQRTDAGHPAHVSAGELLMITGNLGCLHAWFFHGCRWDQGWAGFGSRVHRIDFKGLSRIGPPLHVRSREIKARQGPRRVVLRCEYEFRQDGELVYYGDISAMFFKDQSME